MGREKIIAGNWKMHTGLLDGVVLARAIETGHDSAFPTVILAPPFTHLHPIAEILKNSPVKLAAQNCHFEESGAYTGEISPSTLEGLGVEYVILGHSERRQYFNEDGTLLLKKLEAAFRNHLRPIFCCGESIETREQNREKEFVSTQLHETLFRLDPGNFRDVVIAYEPIWAIGTGLTATPAQAQEMHHFIREEVANQFGQSVAGSTTILYGGSVKPANAAELFQESDVDGALVGGASLEAKGFLEIIRQMPPA